MDTFQTVNEKLACDNFTSDKLYALTATKIYHRLSWDKFKSTVSYAATVAEALIDLYKNLPTHK